MSRRVSFYLLSWRLLHRGDLRGGIEERTARSAQPAHRLVLLDASLLETSLAFDMLAL